MEKNLKGMFELSSILHKEYCLIEFKSIAKEIDVDLQRFLARFGEAYRIVKDAGESMPENLRCLM